MSSHAGQDNGDSSQYVFGFTPPGSDCSDSENELEDRHNSVNCQSPDSGSVHYVVASAGSSHSQLMIIEELNQVNIMLLLYLVLDINVGYICCEKGDLMH